MIENNEKPQSAELYAADEREKQSLIDWYQDHSSVDLHDDGINTLCKICPPEEYGESENCEALQNIMRVMFYRLQVFEAKCKKQEEALREIANKKEFNNNISPNIHYERGYDSALFDCKLIIKQTLKEQKYDNLTHK